MFSKLPPRQFFGFDNLSFNEELRKAVKVKHFTLFCGIRTLYDATGSLRQDPKDKVYTLLGLIERSEGDIGLQSYYSPTASQVYQDLVPRFLSYSKWLDVFGCYEMKGHDSKFTNWAPSWQARTAKLIQGQVDALTAIVAKRSGSSILNAARVHVASIQSARELNSTATKRLNNFAEGVRRLAPQQSLETLY